MPWFMQKYLCGTGEHKQKALIIIWQKCENSVLNKIFKDWKNFYH